MTIDELISKKCNVRTNLSDTRLQYIDKAIRSVLLKNEIEMKVIGTDYVFPRILQNSNGEKALIWDKTYWELYRDFLISLADMNSEQKKINVFFHKDEISTHHPRILVPISYYLALIVKEQSLAINFAKYYYQRVRTACAIRLGMPLNDILRYIEIAKLYIAVHEQMHFQYKHDDCKRKIDMDSLKKQLDLASQLIEGYDEEFCKTKYLKNKNELLEIVHFAYSDNRIQEELLCDTYALNNCFFVYGKCWGKEYTKKEIVTNCIEAIHIVNYFNSLLISLRIFWLDSSCNMNNVDMFRETTALRVYLYEFISAIQLVQQNLYDYYDNNLWKFDGFEDNYFLEDTIYSYFFSEEAIYYWNGMSDETAHNDKEFLDKFKLLNWR